MNIIHLIGRLGKDPEIKETQTTKIATFTVATSKKYKGEQETQWHTCKAFGKTADVISQYFKKGDQIALTGEVQYSEYDGKYYTNVIVNSFEFVGGGKKEENSLDSTTDGLPF